MTIEKTAQGWQCSDIVNGQLLTRQYIGYTKAEAKIEFNALLKQATNGKRGGKQ